MPLPQAVPKGAAKHLFGQQELRILSVGISQLKMEHRK